MPPNEMPSLMLRTTAWFGILGGCAAWIIHFLTISVSAEFGYFAGLQEYTYMGITLIGWVVLLVSIAMIAVASLAVTAAAYATRRISRDECGERSRTYGFVARSGILLSATFVFIIIAEAIPMFFFLTRI